jgi:acetyl esterase/lipase
VVLMVHGGCWRADLPGPELLAWQAEALRRQGLAVWSIRYRRLGHEGGGYPGTFQDVARGADHLRELARDQPLDLSRVLATGHSAGGHLALWLAARKQLPATSALGVKDPLAVHAVVPLAGVGDLAWGAGYVDLQPAARTTAIERIRATERLASPKQAPCSEFQLHSQLPSTAFVVEADGHDMAVGKNDGAFRQPPTTIHRRGQALEFPKVILAAVHQTLDGPGVTSFPARRLNVRDPNG